MSNLKKMLIALIYILISSCTDGHLVYVQETTIGVNASVSMEGPQKLALGYDRDVFGVVPKKGDDGDVMSALSYTGYSYTFPAAFEFNNFVATGQAAVLISHDDCLDKAADENCLPTKIKNTVFNLNE